MCADSTAKAMVSSWAPVANVRTNRGMPSVATTTVVMREPMSTNATVPVARTPRAMILSRANPARSTVTGRSPAASTACTLVSTVSRDAATSIPSNAGLPSTAVVSLVG